MHGGGGHRRDARAARHGGHDPGRKADRRRAPGECRERRERLAGADLGKEPRLVARLLRRPDDLDDVVPRQRVSEREGGARTGSIGGHR